MPEETYGHEFKEYAQIYDSFYRAKNYVEECRNLIKIAGSFTKTLKLGLEIGAGTGAATIEFAKNWSILKLLNRATTWLKFALENYPL